MNSEYYQTEPFAEILGFMIAVGFIMLTLAISALSLGYRRWKHEDSKDFQTSENRFTSTIAVFWFVYIIFISADYSVIRDYRESQVIESSNLKITALEKDTPVNIPSQKETIYSMLTGKSVTKQGSLKKAVEEVKADGIGEYLNSGKPVSLNIFKQHYDVDLKGKNNLLVTEYNCKVVSSYIEFFFFFKWELKTQNICIKPEFRRYQFITAEKIW